MGNLIEGKDLSAQIIKQIATLIQENHFDEARGVISRVAAVQAADPAVLSEVGKLSLLIGDLDDAEKYLRASLALDASKSDTHYQLGLILLKKGKNDLAMPEFREACELKTDFALGHFYWGLTLYGMGNVQGALGQFKQASKIDGTLFVAMYYSGLAYQRLNQDIEARQCFEQVVNKEPDFAAAYNALGVTCLKQNKIEEAANCFEKACKIRPDFANAHFNLANLLAKLGKYESAQLHYREVLDSPDFGATERAIAYNNLAVTFGQLKNWEFASEYLFQGQSIAPYMVELQINLGLVLIALHEYDLAISTFERVLINFPDQFEANFYGGMALLCLAHYAPAQILFDRAANFIASTNQQDSLMAQQLYLWHGYASLANKQYDLAKIQLDKIISLNNTVDKKLLFMAFDGLGILNALSGDQSGAIEYFGKCLNIDNKFALAYLHRARSYEASNQPDLAKSDYAEALRLDPNFLDDDKSYVSQLLDEAQIEEAVTQVIKMVDISPQDLDSKLLLAKALQKKGDYSQAQQLLNDVIKEIPDSVAAYTMLGQIYMSQGNFAQADETFLQASKLENVDSDLFLFWAKALSYLGFHELALEKFKEAAEINPYDGDIYENWAQVLKSIGRFNEASEVYRLASSYL